MTQVWQIKCHLLESVSEWTIHAGHVIPSLVSCEGVSRLTAMYVIVRQ